MTGQTVPYAVLWAPVANATITSLSFIVAAFAFRKTWLINDFNLCRALSEEIEKRWKELGEIEDPDQYENYFVSLLNHYERTCMYLNNVPWFKTRAYKNLKIEVVESLKRRWDDKFFQDCQRKYMSSPKTYTEMRKLMSDSGGFNVQEDSHRQVRITPQTA